MTEKKGPKKDPLAGHAGRAARILVVDDCDKTTKLIEHELKGKGFEITLANSAEEATRLVTRPESRPDLILLDVIMPGVDGRKFCRFIKSNEMFSGIKVILCSGMNKQELKEATEKSGADGYVHKEDILGRWVLEQLKPEKGTE